MRKMTLQQQRTSVKLVIAIILLLLPHYSAAFCYKSTNGTVYWAECVVVPLGFVNLVQCVILACCCGWCCRHKRRKGTELVESRVQLKEIATKEIEIVQSQPDPPSADTKLSHSGVHIDEPQEKSTVGEYTLCGHQESSMELADPFYDTVATSTKPFQPQQKGQEDDTKSTDQKPVTPARVAAAREQETNTSLSGTPVKYTPAGNESTPGDLDPCYDVVDMDIITPQSNAQSLPEYATVNKPKTVAPPVPPYTTDTTSAAESGVTGVPSTPEVHGYVNVNNPNVDPSTMENEYDSIACM